MRFFHFFLFFFPILLVAFGSEIRAQITSGDNGGAKAEVERVLRTQQKAWNRHDLEGFMAGYWNSPELTFFSGAKENYGWQATMDRYRARYASPGHEMGKLEFSGLAHRNAGRRCGLCARLVAIDDVRWEDAAWVVHAGVPQVSRWMEDCARPHFGSGMSFDVFIF